MNGLELSRAYYEAYGAPMLHEQFPQFEEVIAVGLVGAGSECFGYDDEVSRDHDFEPGFCLFLPDEDVIDRRTAFQLERAYAKLPQEFEGISRARVSPVGGSRHGVCGWMSFLPRSSAVLMPRKPFPHGSPSRNRACSKPPMARSFATMWGCFPPFGSRLRIFRPTCG